MASITVDIEARVKGYQEAIEKMRAEFAKLDPGSAMGKSISKALQSADAQVKNLSKNMFPKASSDNQIDAIVEKVNHAGESIREVARLMQQVGSQDLNLGALGGGITDFKNQITALQNEIETKLSQGILNAVNSSEQLKSVFTDILGIDLSKANASDLFAALEKGALKAANAVEQAEAAVNKAQNELNQSKAKVTNLENGLLGTAGSKQQLQDEVRQLENDYNIAITDLRDRVSKGLQKVFSEGKIDDPQKLLDSFFTGLTPDNLKQKIEDLFNQLSLNDTYKNKGDFYKDFFGDFKNINQVLKDIDLSVLATVTEKFKTLIDTVSEKIGSGEAGNIKQLLDNGMLMTAAEQTTKDIEQAYKKVHQAIDRENAKIKDKLKPTLNQALEQQQIAQTQQGVIQKVDTNLQNELAQLKTKVEQQENTIKELNQKIEQITKENVEKVRSGSRTAGAQAGQNMFPTQAIQMYRTELEQVQAKEQMIGKVQGVVQRWFSIYAAVRMVSNAIKSVISTVQELDKTITEIAIVTNMNQDQLWGQMDKYTETARKYATSISGVYKVSQLYYQQGLQQADVMALTEQTLKMARISGLEYATATDYMTNAVRSFKMEMQDAQTVVDVYSAIAASSATSVTELASAMSKTASSAQAVGASFQNTTAMMAVMIEATRESAENIGSAMKSIISRYGELTSDPSKTVDSEGEEMSLNRVDKALRTVGITLQDTTGQFRDFDDVIMELAEKWDTIDKNTQRYIATIMAGNRQQSRFLALVSSYDRLKELTATAADSEDASQLQFLKTLDSIDAKTQQLQTSLQSLYTDTGLEKMYKGLLDYANEYIKTLSNMPKMFNLPIPAILKIGTTFASLATTVTTIFGLIKQKISIQIKALNGEIINNAQQGAIQRQNIEKTAADETIAQINRVTQAQIDSENKRTLAAEQGATRRYRSEKYGSSQALGNGGKGIIPKGAITKSSALKSLGLNIVGLALTSISSGMELKRDGSQYVKGGLGVAGSALSMAGMGAMINPVFGTAIGAALGALMGLVENWNVFFESAEDRAKRLKEAAEEANNTLIQKNADYKSLKSQIEELKELEKTQNDNVEARQKYLDLSNEIAEKYPELVSTYDGEGNATINLAHSYDILTKARKDAAKAAEDSAVASTKVTEDAVRTAQENRFTNFSNYMTTSSNTFIPGSETETYWSRANEHQIDLVTLVAGMTDEQLEANESIRTLQQVLTDYVQGWDNSLLLRLSSKNFKTDLETSLNSEDDTIRQAAEFIRDHIYSYLLSVDASITDLEETNETQEKTAILKAINYKNYERQDIASQQNQTEVLGEMSQASSIVGQYMLRQFNAYKQNLINNKQKPKDSYTKDFLESNEYTEAYETIYNLLNQLWNTTLQTSTQKTQFTTLLNQAKMYGENTFKARLAELGIEQDVIDSIIGIYFPKELLNKENLIQAITNRQEARKNSKKSQGLTLTLTNEYGAQANEAILNVFDILQKQIDTGILDESKGQIALNQYTELWGKIYDIKDEGQRQIAYSLFSQWEDFSLTGVYELQEQLKSKGLNDTNIQSLFSDALKFIEQLPINVNTELETFAKKVTNQVKSFDKALSNAFKGMSFEEAIEMADNLEISIDNFTFKDGKYFYDNVDAIQQAYLKYNEELKKQLDEKYREAISRENLSPDDITKLKLAHDKTTEAIDNYSKYQINAILISNGFLTDFIKNVLGKEADSATIINKILAGDFSNFTGENEQYIGLLMDYVNGIGKSVFDKAMVSLRGEGKQRVTVTESNHALLEKLTGTTISEGTKEVILDLVGQFGTVRAAIVQAEKDGLITKQQMQSYLADLHSSQYKNNITDSLSSIVDNYQSFGYDAAQSLANAFKFSLDKMESEGFISRDAITGQFSTTIENLRTLVALALERGMDIKSYNQYMSKIDKAEREATTAHVIQDVIKSRTSLTEENIQSLADSLKISYDYVKSLLIQNTDGTYTMSLAMLNALVQDGIIEINSALQQLIAEQIDSIISGITGLASSQGRGYTNIADMQKYVQQVRAAGFAQVNGKDVNMQSLFEWDASINAFVLTSAGIISQVAAAKSQLDSFVEGSDEYFAITKLIEDTGRQFAERIDVTSILGGTTGEQRQAVLAFTNAIDDYNAFMTAIGRTAELLDSTQIGRNILGGGIGAVKTAEQIAKLSGKQLSASDVETLYRAQVAPIVDAIDQVESSIGSIVSRDVANIIGLANVTELGTTGQFVVTSAVNLIDAYQKLYDKLLATNEAALSDLNSVMARKLEAKTGANVISALGNAAEMTYTEFGEILTAAGYMLTEETLAQLSNLNILEEIGGGKLRITDFTSFARTMGWDTTSEEYISAFKSYNDAMVALNHKVEQEIAEEVQSISSAKPGDKINVTRLYNELINRIDEQALGELNALLWDLDETTIHNGILDIGENANIVKVMQAIYQIAEQKNLMLADDLAALADAINDVFQSFTATINNGITGKLTQSDKVNLQTMTKNYLGIELNDSSFTRTKEGLKLSQQAAIELYNTLKDIDSISAQIVFDDLSKSLQENNENYKNVSDIMNHIVQLQENIAEADSKGDKTRANQYREELALAKEILAVRSTTEDSSFDFMSNKIPGAQNNPLNYYNSWAKAIKTLQDAQQVTKTVRKGGRKTVEKGFIDYQDWYNIATEMGNIAKLGGPIKVAGITLDGSLEQTAKLIEKGASALTTTDTGEIKVALGGIGLDLTSGANDMTKGVDKGIQAVAKSQIKMLDGMISLLETVVAMEKLGDITGENHVLDLSDMFTIEGNTAIFTKDMQNWASDLLTAVETNKDLANALDSVIFNGTSLRTILENAKNGVQLTEAEAQAYFSAINSLYQMFLSGDYDLNNLMSSISDVAAKSGFEGEIQIGDIKISVGYGFVLKSDKDGTYDVDGTKYTDATAALQAYALKQQSDIENITISTDESGKVTTTGTYTVGDVIFEVVASDGKITYTANDKTYSSKGEAVKAAYRQYLDSEEEKIEEPTPAQWAAKFNVDVTLLAGDVKIDNPEKFQAATHQQIMDLANQLANGTDEQISRAAGEIGIKVDVAGNLTESDRKKIAELAGIENKNVIINASANFTGDSATTLVELLENRSIPITLDVTANDPDNILSLLKNNGITINNENQTSKKTSPTISTEKGIAESEKQKAIAEANARIKQQQDAAIKKAEAEAKTAKAEAAAAKEEANNAKTAEANANARADKAEAEAAAAKNRADQEIAAAKQQADQEVAKIQAEADRKQAAIKSYGDQLSNAAKEYRILLDQKKEVEEKRNQLTDEIATLNTEKVNIEKERNDKIAELAKLNEEYVILNETNQVLIDENNEFKQKNLQYEKQVAKLDAQITDLNGQVAEKETNISQLQAALKQKDAAMTALQTKLTNTETELANARDDLADFQLGLTELNGLIEKYQLQDAAEALLKKWYSNPEETPEVISTEKGIAAREEEKGKAADEAAKKATEEAAKAEKAKTEEKQKQIEATKKAIGETQKELNKYKAFMQTNDRLQDQYLAEGISPEQRADYRANLEGYYGNDINDALVGWQEEIDKATTKLQQLKQQLADLENSTPEDLSIEIDGDVSGLDQKLDKIDNTDLNVNVNVDDNGTASKTSNEIKSTIPTSMTTVVGVTTSGIEAARNAIKKGVSGIVAGVNVKMTKATGNVSLAAGNAMAQGTLMGELGPELVVSKGRYFVVGQEGAEFVNLDKDAIVFNHIQTQSLLKNGKAGRGKPQTNERNATSLATGNVGGGPAMASASAALAALRQLRAQWQALAGLGVSDLAQKAGGGGGGGGGKDKDAAFIRDVERWYNWLQKIAQLEKEITHEEQLRSKLESDRNKNGQAYYESQKKSLADIREQTAVTTSLLTSQQEYFNQRREELNKSPMSRFYTFDENGQLQYTKNPEGFAELSDLFGRNDEGKPNYTAEEQYNKLVAMGYASYMKYDSSGKEIKPEGKKPDAAYFENAVKAFSERMDSEKEEMQSLHDSIEEYQTSILELEQKRNELIQEMIDNQIEVENQVLQAIEDMRQAQIDEAQADRDAYSESTEKYINGLNDALNREKQMYENEENEAELEKLRRQLAILERSGGSASQIAGLQKDIQSKEQDLYFDKQQQQINAIKEASDLQIERMDHQIKIMEETLAYEKAHGLLWEKVYEVMAGTPEEIREFVALNTKALQEQSAAQSEQSLNKMEWQIEQWVAYREDEKKEINTKEADRRWNNSVDSFKTTYSKVYTDELAAKAREAYEASYEKYGDETKAHAAAQEIFKNAQAEYDAAHYVAPTTTTTSAAATTSKSGSGGGNGGNNNKKSSTKKTVVKTSDWEYDAAQHWKTVTYSDGTYGTIDQGNHNKDNQAYVGSERHYKCSKCGKDMGVISGTIAAVTTSTVTSSSQQVSGSSANINGYRVYNKKGKYVAGYKPENYDKAKAYAKKIGGTVKSFKTGGMVDYTGIAAVHGTPSRPESFLNASQTAILKKGLLGGKNSLVSVLADFQAMLEGSSRATVEKNNSSIVIENATVQMNVQHMNNDYDARRAGEQALEQIVKVARKTGAQSVSRR